MQQQKLLQELLQCTDININTLLFHAFICKRYITIFNIAYVTFYKPSIVDANEYGAIHFIFEIFSEK